jgi:integrase
MQRIRLRKQLASVQWPQEIRRRWDAAFVKGDFLDDGGPGAHLQPTSRAALKSACGRFLRYLNLEGCELDVEAPEKHINAKVLTTYVDYRRASCSDRAIAIDLHHLRLALRLIFPQVDWAWLLNATNRIARQAKPRPAKHHLVTSEELYVLGLELMDAAVDAAEALGMVSKTCAFDYRDGLIIALAAVIALRRRTLTTLRLKVHLIRSGNLWALDIPAADMKMAEPIEFLLSAKLSARIDLYFEKFRDRIPGATRHDGLWPSNKGDPMDDGSIYDAVCRHTRKAFGFAVSLHRFRHAALTFWSIHDPKNILGGKDLLGHRSFGTTEKFYIMTQSRVAGRILADAWKKRLQKNSSLRLVAADQPCRNATACDTQCATWSRRISS